MKKILGLLILVLAGTAASAQVHDKSGLALSTPYYVSADRLNVRSSTKIDNFSNVIGGLVRNDMVEIVNLLGEETPLVQIKIISAKDLKTSRTELFVTGAFLSAEKSLPTFGKIDPNKPSKYFVIQNVATEKTRVYERCMEKPGCPHKMVFESDMVVGRPEVGTDEDPHAFKTRVGHSVIRSWVKFYEDGKLNYPAWYHDRFVYQGKDEKEVNDHIPRKKLDPNWLGSGKEWLDKKHLTDKNGRVIGSMRGAFGWYAAKLVPEEAVNYQWLHGTIGWGRDGDAAIQLTRGFLINMFSNPGSSGCTRLENRAIAYLRHLLEPGTHIYRVYAREAMSKAPVMRGLFKPTRVDVVPPGKWEYILTTVDAQKDGGQSADAQSVINAALDVKTILERGFYEYDRTADAAGRDYNLPASSGRSGDRYEINTPGYEGGWDNFEGYYLVDVGLLDGYAHPSVNDGRIVVGGLDDFKTSVPEFLVWKGSKNYYKPETIWKKESNGNN